MIEIDGMSVIYPDKTIAINNISLTIKSGESVALIGANGAGKTSLIMACVGVLPIQGSIKIDNITLTKNSLSDIRARIGVVFQNPDDQLFMATIFDDIAFGLRSVGVPEAEILQRVRLCLSRFNIEHLEHKTALKLSGGEKRMAALCTVLIMQPAVMIFDEPTAFLDCKARRLLINIINTLALTKIVATHDLAFALETCKRTVLLKDGQVFASGLSANILYDEKLMSNCGIEALTN